MLRFKYTAQPYYAPQKPPKAGDLIRNNSTGNFINLVLSVDIENGVHSVRYADVNGGNRILLNGSRVRIIKRFAGWDIVSEVAATIIPGKKLVYNAYDNKSDIAIHLASLEGKDLYYRAPETQSDA